MRVKSILSVSVLAIASVGISFYILANNKTVTNAIEIKPLHNAANLAMSNSPSIDKNSEHRLDQLTTKVAVLETKLKHMEFLVSEQAKNLVLSDSSKNLANKQEKTKPKQFSEADFSHWLDETLSAGHFDADETQVIMDKAEKSLAVLPDVSVEGMECGKSFCRAKFTSETGKPFNVAEVFGASSFMGSGFTINEPDGSVKVYFTQPGQSIDELRREAEKTVFGE